MATSSEGLSSTDLDLNDLPEWAKLSDLITAIGLTLGEEARNYLHEEIDGRDDLPTFVYIPDLLAQLRELGLQDEGLSSTDLNLNDLPESAHLSEVITAIGQKLGEEARNYLHEKLAGLDDLPTLVNVPKLLKEIQELNGGDEEKKEALEEATETTTTMVTSPSSWDRMNDKFENSGFQSYIKESISLPLRSDLADDPEVTTASVPPPAPNSEDFRSNGSANNLVETRSTFHIAANNSSALTREDFEAATSSEVSIHGESGSQNLYPGLLNLSDLAEQEMYGTSAGHMTDASSSRFHSADDPEVTTASVPPPAPNSEDFRSSGSANNLVETRSTFHIAANNSSALTREDFEAATSSEVSIHGESGSQNLYRELLNLSDLAEQEMYGTSAGHMTDASSSRFHSADDPEVTTASVPPPAPNSEDFRSSGSANNLVETRSTFHIAANNPSALTQEDFEAATSSEVSIHGESGSQNLYRELLNLSDLAEQEMYGTSAGHMTDASSSIFHSMFGADDEEPDLDVKVYLFKPDQSPDRP